MISQFGRRSLLRHVTSGIGFNLIKGSISRHAFSTTSWLRTVIEIPKGAWDTHIHVFDPEKWPYAASRRYTPARASIEDYPEGTTGCTSLVVVHASMQGASPAPLVDVLSKEGSMAGYTLRGLATLNIDSLTDGNLDKLHAAGIRGTRMHLMTSSAPKSLEEIGKRIEAYASRVARLGWVIDLFCSLETWAGMTETLLKLDPRIKLVADHLGSAFPGDEKKPEFQALLHLIKERLYVKVAAFERIYDGNPEGIDSLAPATKAIIEVGGERIMYGSDWPHTQLGSYRKGKTQEQKLTEVEPFRNVPNGRHIEKLREWIEDEETWQNLWVHNPKRVFE